MCAIHLSSFSLPSSPFFLFVLATLLTGSLTSASTGLFPHLPDTSRNVLSCSKISFKGDSFHFSHDAKKLQSDENAFVVFPGNPDTFSMNVKYSSYYDETFGFLEPSGAKKCYVVPRFSTLVSLNASGKGMTVYSVEASSNKGDSAGECPDKLQACQVVGPCTFYDVSRLKCNSGARVRARDTETDGFIDEVENLKRELADRDKVLEVFIVKARSAQKWIAVIYFILGVVFTLTVLLLLKVRGMMNGSRPYSSSLL